MTTPSIVVLCVGAAVVGAFLHAVGQLALWQYREARGHHDREANDLMALAYRQGHDDGRAATDERQP